VRVAAPSLRLFFALWPDVAVRVALDALARRIVVETGGRAVAADNLHLTLAFLGERPAAMVPELCEGVSTIAVSPFRLSLDDVGCWRKAGIAWLAAREPGAQMLELREHIVRALAALHIVIEERRFVAHVTLARRIESIVARQLTPPIDWQVGSFALVASRLDPRGVHYEALHSWPLSPAST
jgi:RNA 2',3'-cyclic 3'-phosphodiesterase